MPIMQHLKAVGASLKTGSEPEHQGLVRAASILVRDIICMTGCAVPGQYREMRST